MVSKALENYKVRMLSDITIAGSTEIVYLLEVNGNRIRAQTKLTKKTDWCDIVTKINTFPQYRSRLD